MAAYGTLVAWAQAMGHTEAAKLLQQTLDEEKAADKKLSGLAESGINQSAADAAHPEGKQRPLGRARLEPQGCVRKNGTPLAAGRVGRVRHGLDPAAVAYNRQWGSRRGRTRRDATRIGRRFKGVTAYVRSPAKGLWTAPDGHTEADEW